MEDHQITEAVEEVDREASRFEAFFDDVIDRGEHACVVFRCKGMDRIVDKREACDTEQRQGALIGQALWARAGDELVEDGEAVAGAAAAGADDQWVDGIVDVDAFAIDRIFQHFAHIAWGEQAEWVIVRAGTDRADHFVRLGGGEDENQVRWWLFNDFQQGIEALGTDHVGFVNDEHAVARFRRGVVRAFAQFTHVIDTIVTRGVELCDIKGSRATRGQRYARITHPTRRGSWAFHAIEGPGKDACRRRLATTTRTRKKVRMVDAPAIQSCGQRVSHLRLPN